MRFLEIDVEIGMNAEISGDVCIGHDTIIRESVKIKKLNTIGMQCFIDCGTVINEDCCLGDFVSLGCGCVVNQAARIGDYSVIGNECLVDNWAILGRGVVIGPESSVGEGAEIGDDAHIGARVTILNEAIIRDRVYIPSFSSIYYGEWGIAPPMARICSRLVQLVAPDEVRIGCVSLTFGEWRERGESIAREEGLSIEEIELYKHEIRKMELWVEKQKLLGNINDFS